MDEVFVEAYTNPDSPTVLNATRSYKLAHGCADSTANTAGSKTLDRPIIKKTIKERLEDKGIESKIANNVEKLVDAAALAPASDWKAQTLGLKANEFVKDIMGWKQPEQHLHVNLTPEDREKEYEAIIKKIRDAQGTKE